MTQVQIQRFGGPDVFRTVERPSPPMLPDHVRIAAKAAGINFADVQMRMGLYPEAPKVPFVPGYEVAGVVSEVGPGGGSFSMGQRVMAACRFGGYATEIVLPAFQVRPTPPHLSDSESAAIPVAFMTAWIALMEMARVREGDRVLVPGAAGGVGSAMVQIAATAGRGFSLILDPRGGAALKDSTRRLGPGARVVSYGVSSMVTGRKRSILHALLQFLQMPLFNPIGLSMANRGVFGLNILKLFETEEGRALLMKAMDGALEGFLSHRYKAMAGRTFPLSEAGEAHSLLQSRKNVGKIVLICS